MYWHASIHSFSYFKYTNFSFCCKKVAFNQFFLFSNKNVEHTSYSLEIKVYKGKRVKRHMAWQNINRYKITKSIVSQIHNPCSKLTFNVLLIE